MEREINLSIQNTEYNQLLLPIPATPEMILNGVSDRETRQMVIAPTIAGLDFAGIIPLPFVNHAFSFDKDGKLVPNPDMKTTASPFNTNSSYGLSLIGIGRLVREETGTSRLYELSRLKEDYDTVFSTLKQQIPTPTTTRRGFF